MDLFLVSLLLQSVILLPSVFPETQADQDPFNKYSEYLNTKDVKEDMKRRRKLARSQPISLKPPPQDWPEPQLAAGDFIVTGQSEATSLSPLLAYQAKLEKEYENQRKEKMKKEELTKEKSDSAKVASTFTSSEEDLQMLLDPDELLKHNKQLRPFVHQGKNMKSPGDQVLADKKQGKEAKPAGISSLTALKAKTAARKGRKKAKSATFMMTTTFKPRKGRRRKTTQIKESDSNVLSEEQKRKKSRSHPSNLEPTKTKQMRKRTRGFTFAERKYEEYDRITTRGIKLKYKTPGMSWKTVTSSSEKEIQKGTYSTSTAIKVEEISTIDSNKTAASNKESDLKYSLTASPIKIPLISTEDSTSFNKSSAFVSTTSEVTSDTTTNDIQKVTYPASTTTEVQDHMETTKSSSYKTITITKETDKEYSLTVSSSMPSKPVEDISSLRNEFDLDLPILEETITFGTTESNNMNTTTNEIRKKRKEIKQEMEKVLEAEELEGSFTDTDSDWTTSEEAFYVEYIEMEKSFKKKIEVLKKTRTTQKPPNATTFKNIYKNIIQLLN